MAECRWFFRFSARELSSNSWRKSFIFGLHSSGYALEWCFGLIELLSGVKIIRCGFCMVFKKNERMRLCVYVSIWIQFRWATVQIQKRIFLVVSCRRVELCYKSWLTSSQNKAASDWVKVNSLIFRFASNTINLIVIFCWLISNFSMWTMVIVVDVEFCTKIFLPCLQMLNLCLKTINFVLSASQFML